MAVITFPVSKERQQWLESHDAEIQDRLNEEVKLKALLEEEGRIEFAAMHGEIEERKIRLHADASKQQAEIQQSIQRNDDTQDSEANQADVWIKVNDIVQRVQEFMQDAGIQNTASNDYLRALVAKKAAVASAAHAATASK